MFTRATCRLAAPLNLGITSTRSYASQGTAARAIGPVGYMGIAALAGGGGYFYYVNAKDQTSSATGVSIPDQIASKLRPTSPKAFVGGSQDFLSLELEKIEDVNHNTKQLTFSLPEKNQVSGLPVASALITRFKAEGMEKPVIRPYTPTSDEDREGSIEFIIKRYENGPMSEHLHSMKPGELLDIKGPIPKYSITPNKHNSVAMIAGGTGITPMYQVARAIFKNPDDKTKVVLIFGNISEEDILLKDKFDELENMYPQRFKAFYTLDKPPKGWQHGKGFINKDLLKTVLPEPKEANIKILVCGPPGLYKAISGPKISPKDQGELTGALKELGYSQDQVFKF